MEKYSGRKDFGDKVLNEAFREFKIRLLYEIFYHIDVQWTNEFHSI